MTLPLLYSCCSSYSSPLAVRYLLIICSHSIDSIPEFQHFTHGVQVMTSQLLSFNFNFATQQKKQSDHKCVVNFNHRIIIGSCPEPKTFYLMWIMLIHNFVLYNIIIIIINIPPPSIFCQAKQVLNATREAQKKPKRWLITVSLVKWYKKSS